MRTKGIMALDPRGWPAIWEGFKSRFAELFRQVAAEARQQDQ